jgi:hypothetical protein
MKRPYRRIGFTPVQNAELWGRWREQYGDDAEAAFFGYKAILRRSCVETMAVAICTGALTVWFLSMPPDWPYAIIVVPVHVALSIVASFIGVQQEAREADALSRKLAA